MHESIGFCFNGGDNTYFIVTKYRAKQITDPSSYPISFNKKDF